MLELESSQAKLPVQYGPINMTAWPLGATRVNSALPFPWFVSKANATFPISLADIPSNPETVKGK